MRKINRNFFSLEKLNWKKLSRKKKKSPPQRLIIFIIITYCELFTHVLTGGFSLKSEEQQVSSDLHKPPKYSNWS